ncbi:DUF3618 domain-containing protein, partial [Oceaniglobus roseus]|uniref:DUF3618 domain-containing protein n=1 Tax=Oceaniglobus roseus TaxID=1737570 RepID=UPI0012FFD350
MPSETRTPEDIERDLERRRSNLSRSIDEIQSRISPDALMHELADGVQTYGKALSRSIGHTAQHNPVGLTLVGAGLAMMMFGRSHHDDDDDHDRAAYRARRPASYDRDPLYGDRDRDRGIDGGGALRRTDTYGSAASRAPGGGSGRLTDPAWMYALDDPDETDRDFAADDDSDEGRLSHMRDSAARRARPARD